MVEWHLLTSLFALLAVISVSVSKAGWENTGERLTVPSDADTERVTDS